MPHKINRSSFLFLGGPCVIESEKLCFQVAEKLLEASRQVGFQFIFKAVVMINFDGKFALTSFD